jgi:hypothetical protein
MGIRNADKILVGKSEGRRPLERSRCRGEDNIESDLKETDLDCKDVDWIHLTQNGVHGRGLVNTIMKL